MVVTCLNEFELIERYLKPLGVQRADIVLGMGDDGAILRLAPDEDLVCCLDTLVEGRHFLPNTAAADIAYKALAVNLSDIAAMGATPRWVTLGLTLPEANPAWLQEFAAGLNILLQKYELALVGGDTTRGPILTISLQVQGALPRGRCLPRHGAQVGDSIVVSGSLGDGRLALDLAWQKKIIGDEAASTLLMTRLRRPTPRVELGLALLAIAHSAIDISDGLVGDLGHILKQSQLGATLYAEKLPLSAALKNHCSTAEAWRYALAGGDDYELCFTLPSQAVAHLQKLATDLSCPLTVIGQIEKEPGLRVYDGQGKLFDQLPPGFDHFEE